MHPTTVISCLCFAAASLSAQGFVALPSTANPAMELGSYSLLPFTRADARIQVFYDQAEVGAVPFTATQLALRYDGPIPAVGVPGPFTITRLQIRLGVSSIVNPGADFAANLTQPLLTVFDGPHTYLPDDGSASPHAWGGPGGTLTFPFSVPAPITVGAGEWLVVEMQMEGNTLPLSGLAHPMLDGAVTSGGFANGTAVNYGQGCPAGAGLPDATANATGLFGPGGVHLLGGQNLGANTIVFAAFGLSDVVSFVSLPFNLPGTSCSLLASPDVTSVTISDATGTIGGANAVALSLEANPAFSGVQVFEQLVSFVPGANAFDLVFSNAVAVTLGTWTPPGRGTHLIAHDVNANAPYANSMRAFGYAMRLTTL